MEPSSRTPEGEPNRCPVCGKSLEIDPSRPPGDAPCPHCGTLLWFNPDDPNGPPVHEQGSKLSKLYKAGLHQAKLKKYDYAIELLAKCVRLDPGNYEYVREFIGTIRSKYGSSERIGPMVMFKRRGERSALRKAISEGKWDEAIQNGLTVLEVNPWDVSTLRQMATACGSVVAEKGYSAQVQSTYGDCELFYLKCASDTVPRGHPDVELLRQMAEALEKRQRYLDGLDPPRRLSD
jgi:tetratricopeptide (TPR) repeat protein